MADALYEADAPPPVPGFWRLGWLLFMQPFTLSNLFGAWGLEKDPSLWGLRGRLRERDPVVRSLVARLGGWLLLVMPVSAVVVASSRSLVGLPVDWSRVVIDILIGILFGSAISGIGITSGVAFGVVAGIAKGFAGDFTLGVAGGLSLGVAIGLPAGITAAVAGGFAWTVGRGVAACATLGVIFGLTGGLSEGLTVGFVGGIAAGVGFLLALFRLPFYPAELTLTLALRLAARLRPASLPRLASYLPYRHHELIYLPLLFLSDFLVRLGERDPAEGRRALAEAAASLSQKGPARRALVELQARSLERAARERQYALAAALALPFLPSGESLHQNLAEARKELERARELLAVARSTSSRRQRFPSILQARKELAQAQEIAQTLDRVTAIGESFGPMSQPGYRAILVSIAASAQDLEAARSTSSHYQRRQALTRAKKSLERILDRLTTTRRLAREERRFLPVVKQWLDRVEDEEVALARLEQEQPQVPLVFIAGVPITPADESLFVGRRDLVRILDQDLATDRPVPLVLLGQRRMGKSTLLNFLPRLLGTGTRVARLDFQGLSGHPLKGEPHRWVAVEVATALAIEKIEMPSSPPEKAPWMAVLDWLSILEEPLAASDRRLLIALDEVEGLERGIREGWSDPAFLDFLRAAGDRLRRIRFLLVTAHPFSRLGPHWSDRLISAQTRRIEPLAEEEARALLTRPVPGFPDIYPPGGVNRLLAETACHPYLLQLTAYHLTRRLNDAGRLKATDDDITAAVDQALEENNLFQYMWDDLTAAEQRLIAALARGEEPAGETAEMLSQARRRLAGEQLIQRGGDGDGWQVAVPLFARWIREIGAAE